MKLIFKKVSEGNISIQLVTGTSTINFSYVDMIKELLTTKSIEEPIFEGEISEDEKQRIKSMLDKIGETAIEGNG